MAYGTSKQRLLEAEYNRAQQYANNVNNQQALSPINAIVNALAGAAASDKALGLIEQAGQEEEAQRNRVMGERNRILGIGSPVVDALAQNAPAQQANPAPAGGPVVDALAGKMPTPNQMRGAIPNAFGPMNGPQGDVNMPRVPAGEPMTPQQFSGAVPQQNMQGNPKLLKAMQLMELQDPVSQAIGQAMLTDVFKTENAKPDIRQVGGNLVDVTGGQPRTIYEKPKTEVSLGQKEKTAVLESEEKIRAGQLAVQQLERAIELAKGPLMTGAMAGTRSAVSSSLPDWLLPDTLMGGSQAEAANSQELQNIIGQQVLSSLKATFGGNPTEGERMALEAIQGNINKGPEVLQRSLNSALELARQRIANERDYANQIKSGAIFEVPPEVPNGQ